MIKTNFKPNQNQKLKLLPVKFCAFPVPYVQFAISISRYEITVEKFYNNDRKDRTKYRLETDEFVRRVSKNIKANMVIAECLVWNR